MTMPDDEQQPTRSLWQLWLPTVVLCAALCCGVFTSIVAISWYWCGVTVLTRQQVDGSRCYGHAAYRQGLRRLVIALYHVGWWPTYVGAPPKA